MSIEAVCLDWRKRNVLCLQELGTGEQEVVLEVKSVVVHICWHYKAVGAGDFRGEGLRMDGAD